MARPPSGPAQAFEQAVALFQQGHLDEADKVATRAAKDWPGIFDIVHLLGVIRLQHGKPGAALGLFEQALKLNPDAPEALANLGMTLARLNRHEEGLALFGRALVRDPDNWQTLNNRGSLLLGLNRAAEALADFERALALAPGHPGIRLNRGNALAQLLRCDEAVAEYDAVLAVMPQNAEAHFNRGNALAQLGHLEEEAVASFDRALALRPDYPKALTSRGVTLQSLNRHQDAIADFEQALAIDRANADVHHNAALALLTLGNYRRGFEEYEWRWRRSGMPPRRGPGRPLWLGEFPLARKTILLQAEQGLGDCIQFVRYAPLLASAGATVVLEAPPALAPLFARVDGVAQVVVRGEPLPAFDVHCPLGSLPRALRTETASIPADVPYLAADRDRLDKWRSRLAGLSGRRVAIAWAGNPDHPNDRNRSIPLAALAPLLSCEGIGFVSIQRDLRGEDAATLATMPQLTHVGEALDDFDDTAAVMALVDRVIAVDTSVVHLAGALGRPVSVLVPFSPDWRWMLDRADAPWYPTARLFRQSVPGDWANVIERVRADLLT